MQSVSLGILTFKYIVVIAYKQLIKLAFLILPHILVTIFLLIFKDAL